MTKFTFQGSGQTAGDGGAKALGVLAAVGIGAVIAYKALGSAASTLGDLLVIVPIAVGSLAVGAVVTYVVVKARRLRQPLPAARPAAAPWQPTPHTLPPREARAINPAPVVTINFGADLLAGFMAAAQQQQPVHVIATPANEEITS
jgi:hypothetical protein